MDKTRLQIILSKLKQIDFKIEYEQYPTPPDVAAEILWKAYLMGDIEDKVVADFGTGNGIFAIGAKLLGAKTVYAIEIDRDAIEVAKENAKNLGLDISFLNIDVRDFDKKVDTVIMNPPFGLKLKGADRRFLRKAFEVSKVIYCIHKIESDRFFKTFAKDFGFNCELLFSFDYKLPAVYSFHEKRFYTFKAGVWRFERVDENGK